MNAKSSPPNSAFQILTIGSLEFCGRLNSSISSHHHGVKTLSCVLSEAWSNTLALRPDCLIIEVGFQYSDRSHQVVRGLLSQVRQRLDEDIYVIIALVDPAKAFFAGDLLYEAEDSLNASGYVDTFIVAPPGAFLSIPTLSEQAVHAISIASLEMRRRTTGHTPLPPLNSKGWVQSLADPQSRELWSRWLPRYASYTNENPIIIGHTGTGKTNLAYALHLLSGRKGQFISITPRDFSSSELVQAELFGAVAGAYTGAVDKWGLVKSAEKGTLFIDELQSIDKELQGKLITFIENKSYRRVGSTESISADVRFVFASNRSLYDMMDNDVLRHDFAYRLERVQLELLPLSQRRLDIATALAYALAKVRRQRPHAYHVHGFNPSAYRLLFSQQWPGNLRQLENRVAQLCELADLEQTSIIQESHVGAIFEARSRGVATTVSDIISQAALQLSQNAFRESVRSMEDGVERFRELVRETALEASGGDYEKAAVLVGDDRNLLELITEAAVAERETKPRTSKPSSERPIR